MGMKGNVRWSLMGGLRIRAGVCGVHDVVVVICGTEMAGALNCMAVWVVAEWELFQERW